MLRSATDRQRLQYILSLRGHIQNPIHNNDTISAANGATARNNGQANFYRLEKNEPASGSIIMPTGVALRSIVATKISANIKKIKTLSKQLQTIETSTPFSHAIQKSHWNANVPCAVSVTGLIAPITSARPLSSVALIISASISAKNRLPLESQYTAPSTQNACADILIRRRS